MRLPVRLAFRRFSTAESASKSSTFAPSKSSLPAAPTANPSAPPVRRGNDLSTVIMRRVTNAPTWAYNNKRNFAMLLGAITMGVSSYYCMNRIPGGHAGLLKDKDSNEIDPYTIYEENMVALINPIKHEIIPLRLLPVKKRFIRNFTTKDNKKVEVRMVVRLEPLVHWLPEIYKKFGRDFSRKFVETECQQDLKEVIEKYDYKDLVIFDGESGENSNSDESAKNDEEIEKMLKSQKVDTHKGGLGKIHATDQAVDISEEQERKLSLVIDEVKERFQDASAFFHLKMDKELELQFLKPLY